MAKPKKPAQRKPKSGRPTKYQDSYASQTEALCRFGATDEEIADFFGINVATLYRWKHIHPAFCDALKVGKEILDDRVERSLYQRAVGYRASATKIFMPAGAKAPVYAPYMENVQPDTTAQIFWLKNRRGEEWRDKRELEHAGAGGGPIQTEEITDTRALARKIALMLSGSRPLIEA